nr:hypothetical protein [Mycoplasma mycoides]
MNQVNSMQEPISQNNKEQEKKIKDHIHVNPWKMLFMWLPLLHIKFKQKL